MHARTKFFYRQRSSNKDNHRFNADRFVEGRCQKVAIADLLEDKTALWLGQTDDPLAAQDFPGQVLDRLIEEQRIDLVRERIFPRSKMIPVVVVTIVMAMRMIVVIMAVIIIMSLKS